MRLLKLTGSHGIGKYSKVDNDVVATQSKSLTFNLQEMTALVKEGNAIVLNGKAELSLLKFLQFCKQVDKLKEELKEQILISGNAIMPNFKGVEGEKVKISVREYGARYEMNSQVEDEFVITRKYVDADKVDAYIKENGTLPKGIEETQREGKLSISLKE